jgi:hypothetical protein
MVAFGSEHGGAAKAPVLGGVYFWGAKVPAPKAVAVCRTSSATKPASVARKPPLPPIVANPGFLEDFGRTRFS